MNFSLCRCTATIGIGLAAIFSVQHVQAVCRSERTLVALQSDVAKQHFTGLLKKLPEIFGCDESDFPNDTLGDFNPDAWRIRVLMKRNSLSQRVIVAHELGHAQASLQGEIYGPFKGHGQIWLHVMIDAGFDAEAQRTAGLTNYYPGLLQVYQTVASGERSMGKRAPNVDVVALLNERPAVLDLFLKPID